MFDSWNDALTGHAVALGVGLLVGAERERRKGTGPDRSAFGVRSFTIVAMTGSVAAQLGSPVAFAIAGAAVVALAVAGYLRSAEADPGLTTEISWCLTFLLGALAIAHPQLVAGLGTLLALVLVSRPWLHALVRDRLSEREALDAILLAGTALVALPLLPDRTVDPWRAINPQVIGRLTVLVLVLNAVGYVALRAFGARLGLPLAGFFGGFVSSTATIASLGRRARASDALRPAAVAGATLSSVATVIQLAAMLAAVNLRLLGRLWPALLAMGVVAIAWALLFVRRAARAPAPGHVDPGRAFELRHAVLVALAMTAVVALGAVVASAFGSTGALVGIAVAGFADTHAAAASSAALERGGQLPLELAVLGVLAALATNTVSKCVAAWAGGGAAYAGRLAPGLVLMLAAFAAVVAAS